ncbi:hypothetical protein L1887_63119 [Cichorium endivia]|nr:hypothetical protein L1887_63119 [Cichorium endivia]
MSPRLCDLCVVGAFDVAASRPPSLTTRTPTHHCYTPLAGKQQPTMSRSLRSRPMTLYAQEGQPVIPPVPSTHAYPHASSSSSSQPSQSHDAPRQAAAAAARGMCSKSPRRRRPRWAAISRSVSRCAMPSRRSWARAGSALRLPSPACRPCPRSRSTTVRTATMDERFLAPVAQSASRRASGDDDDAAYDPDDAELNALRKSSDTARTRTDVYEGDPAVDLQLLSQAEFDPQAYLRAKLSHHSESSLRTFKASLAAAKHAANDDLKRQVFRNYSEFITISKEIATLENDMLELKELLAEWKQLPHALELDDSSSSFSSFSRNAKQATKTANRNSTVDLQQIYRAQITSLWEGIEGSQKFLPYVPGRHLIAEASSFTELNAATYKPQHSVALFLLDDLLLIATRRKRQMSSKVRLVAERCFSLAEIVVIDLKDGGDLTNAIKIKRARESYVYRTDRAEDKRALLNAFRRVAEELAKKRRNDADYGAAEAAKRHSTLLASPTLGQTGFERADGASSLTAAFDTLLTPIGEDGEGGAGGDGGVMAAAAATAASERKDPGRWNNEFADELAVCIALREWEHAVTLIEKGRGVLSTYTSSDAASVDLASKLAVRAQELVTAISGDFMRQSLKKSAVVRNASYLLRLDRGEEARRLFLDARTQLLKKRTRQIKFEGDTGALHLRTRHGALYAHPQYGRMLHGGVQGRQDGQRLCPVGVRARPGIRRTLPQTGVRRGAGVDPAVRAGQGGYADHRPARSHAQGRGIGRELFARTTARTATHPCRRCQRPPQVGLHTLQ